LSSERTARAQLDEILVSRQIVMVTGKGGVGKSIVSAALALRARQLGLRPLVFELDAPPRTSLFPDGRPAGDEVGEVCSGILGINQRSDEAIRDYAISTLPSRTVAELLFENRISKLFLRASPSVSEMALVGRVAILAEKHGADGPVIVDLHATGHALSLVQAPAGIMKVLRGGVLHERARRIEEILSDPRRTAFVTVALPEELPVTELLELRTRLLDLKAPLGPVVLNGVVEDPAPLVPDEVVAHLEESPLRHAAHDLHALRTWARRAAREKERLAAALAQDGAELLTLPFIHDELRPGALAGLLADKLGGAS
jgi:anion-transporting  ArsA/GET3 family ATPase